MTTSRKPLGGLTAWQAQLSAARGAPETRLYTIVRAELPALMRVIATGRGM